MATAEAPTEVSEPAALFKKRGAKKSSIRKREATPPSADDATSGSDFTDDEGRQVKRRRKAGGVTATSARSQPPQDSLRTRDSHFAADRSAAIASTNDATKHADWYDEAAAAKHGPSRGRPAPAAPEPAPAAGNDGTYKGAAQYQSFITKNPNAPAKPVGPVRAAANVRTITVTDFAPDVCKDYKQTGFCGFGDSCKFLHAREDYKQGWQLDREWENVTKGKKGGAGGQVVAGRRREAGGEAADEDEDEEALLEGIPFACIVCKEGYKNPIVTKCGHYFCEACALKRYKKTPNCAACGAGTGGVFNGARNLKRLLERKRERAARLGEAEDEDAGGDDE